MKALYIFLIFLYGCTLPEPKIMKGLMEDARKVPPSKGTVYKDLTYKKVMFKDLTLDIYYPKDGRGELVPANIYFHGGAWLFGDKELVRVQESINDRLEKNRIATISFNYRFPTQVGTKKMVEDCIDAVNWIRENGSKYGIDGTKLGLQGASAGAHLALLTAFEISKSSNDIKYVINQFAPTDMVRLKNSHRGTLKMVPFLFLSMKTLKRLSPLKYVHENSPDILVIHGDKDDVVPLEQSNLLVSSLNWHKVYNEYYVFKGAEHGFVNLSGKELDYKTDLISDFMIERLRN